MAKQNQSTLLCRYLGRYLVIASLLAGILIQPSVSAAACKGSCIASTLYQSEDSSLSFTLYRLTDRSTSSHSEPVVRHEYQIILTQSKTRGAARRRTRLNGLSEFEDYTSITVYDALARAHTFRQLKDGTFEPLVKTSGHLTRTQAGFVWTTPEQVMHGFRGSRLQTIDYPSGQKLALSYDDDQLIKITDHTGKSLNLIYHRDRLISLKKPNGTYVAIKPGKAAYKGHNQEECNMVSTTQTPPDLIPTGDPSPPPLGQHPDIPVLQPDHVQAVENPATEENHCESDAALAHEFQTPASPFVPVTMIDARPESCESYFVEYYGTVRGFEIEAGLAAHAPYNTMQPTIRVFPVVDFIDGGDLYVVHSRDLGSSSYNSESNPDALLDALLADGREIRANFLDRISEHGYINATEMGQQTTIHADSVDSVTLQIVIRDGIASPAHWLQMKTAREQLLQEYGIDFQIIVIP